MKSIFLKMVPLTLLDYENLFKLVFEKKHKSLV